MRAAVSDTRFVLANCFRVRNGGGGCFFYIIIIPFPRCKCVCFVRVFVRVCVQQ